MLKTNRHAIFNLEYHLVLITKYRHPVLTGQIKDKLIEITKHYFENNGLTILELGIDRDHIHIMFDAKPQITLSKCINGYKTLSSHMIRREFKDKLSKYYSKPVFWSNSYFICTVSENSRNNVIEYIKNQ